MSEENNEAKSGSPLIKVLLGVLILVGLVYLLLPTVGSGRASPRAISLNNLHNVTIALMSYQSTHRELPAAAVRDAGGNPLYSWRVSILPQLDETARFEQLAKDEPWNSDHNRALLARMPPYYQCLSDDDARTDETSIVAVIGDGTLWPAEGAGSLESVPDGPATTILLVMLAQSGIHWAEPRDLTVAELLQAVKRKEGPGPHLIQGSYVIVATADGAVRFLEAPTAQEIKAMLTRAGGEAVVLP